MTPKRSSPRSGLAIFRGCLALLAIGLVAPRSAEAAHCSAARNSPAIESALARLLDGDGDARAVDAPVVPAAPGRPVPCSGPSCSGRDPAPWHVPTPAPVSSASGEDHAWAWLSPGGDDAAVRSRRLAPEAPADRPIDLAPAIFHPPRVAARPA